MSKSIVLTVLCVSISMVGAAQWAGAADAPSVKGPAPASAAIKHRVVFQVSDNDPAKWNLALGNVRNVQLALGEKNVEIEIVVYGPAIGMLKMDSPAGNRVGEAISTGVRVVACENTMISQKLQREDMLPRIEYVKAAVVELMEKQRQGWAYIRP